MSRQIGNYLAGHVPPNRNLFGGTVPPNRKLFGGTVPPNSFPQNKRQMQLYIQIIKRIKVFWLYWIIGYWIVEANKQAEDSNNQDNPNTLIISSEMLKNSIKDINWSEIPNGWKQAWFKQVQYQNRSYRAMFWDREGISLPHCLYL